MKVFVSNWITLVLELSTVIAAIQLNGTLQVSHELNLVWAQRDEQSKISRLVGVSGDPNIWIPTHVASSKYITAPGNTWKFLALDFDYKHQQLFWSDAGNNRIQGYFLNGSTQPFDLYTGTSSQVEGIAVDWLRGNLYWCDAVYNWIGMTLTSFRKDKRVHRIVVDTGLDQPRDIVVDAVHRKLFWSDTGVVPKIETSDLTGLNRKILVFTGLSQPSGLTYDVESRTLYWIDRGLHRVESISSDGQKRQILLEDAVLTFRALTTYGDYIFVTEQSQKQLIVYKKSSGERDISFSINGAMPYDVIMYDPAKQPSVEVSCSEDTCDHMCTENELGESLCVCSEGYKLTKSGRRCAAHKYLQPPQIIYTIGAAVCSFPANIPDISIDTISLDKYCILTEQNTTALAFSTKEQVLYLYDSFTQSISRVRLMSGKAKELHSIRNVGHVRFLALDWVGLNLYWIDDVNGRLIVMNHQGGTMVTLLTNLNEPKGLALDAVSRKLFWSVIGANPRIETSKLDGSERRSLITEDILDPSHLTVDYVSYRLYWCDRKLGRIEWSSFDGTIRQAIMEQPGSSFSGLTIFQDFVLWTETGSSNGLHVAYKDSGQKIRGVIHPKVGQAGPVITYDKSSQPTVPENPCEQSKCHQVCIPVDGSSYKCHCGLGYKLEKTGYSCKTEHFTDNFLVFTEHFNQAIFQLSLDTRQIRALPIPNVGHPHALTFDPMHRRLYWTDVTYKLIKTARLDGSEEKVLAILNRDAVPDGIAVASQSGLIYYTDGGTPLIGVIDITSQYHLTLIKHRLNKPRAIALFEERGLMFWTDWGTRSRIERSDMSGGSRKQIISTGTGAWPNGLTIDKVSERLYWCDAKQRLVETSDFEGKHRRILARIPLSHIFALTLLDRNLYYSDWRKRSLMQMQMTGQKATVQAIGPADFSKINGIDSYRQAEPTVSLGGNQCEMIQQNCSHICIPIFTKAVCQCPDGVQMSKDGINCLTDKWLTNAAPFIIPTADEEFDEVRSHVTTKPSLLSKYNRSSSSHAVPTINNTTSSHQVQAKQNTMETMMPAGIGRKEKGTEEEKLMEVTDSSFQRISLDNQNIEIDNADIDGIKHHNVDQEVEPEHVDEDGGLSYSAPAEAVSPAGDQTVLDNETDDYVKTKNIERVSVETKVTTDSYLDLETGKHPTEKDWPSIQNSVTVTYGQQEVVSQHKFKTVNTGKTTEFSKSENVNGSIHSGNTSIESINTDVSEITSSLENRASSTSTVTATIQPSTLSNAGDQSLNNQHPVQQEKQPAVIALNNTNQMFNIKTIIPDMATTKIYTTSEGSQASTTKEQQPNVNETPVFTGTTKREMLGLLLTVCVAAILVCACLTCCVLCYNKMYKKKKKRSCSTDIHSRQADREVSKIYNTNHFELATDKKLSNNVKTQQVPSPMYASPNTKYNRNNKSKIATIRIKSSGRQKHYSQSSQVFATEVTKKYASMSDSQFTGHPDSKHQPKDVNNHMDNYSYQPDSGSDFSFDSSVDSNNVPDFVTFKYGHDSHV